MAERWLVIGHEATNSGAPRMLLRVLREVKKRRNNEWSCEIVLRYGGPLRDAFAELGQVHVLASAAAHPRTLSGGLIRKFIDRPWLQPRRFARVLAECKRTRFDLVYSNTGTNGLLVSESRRLGCPVVSHVHELADGLRRFNTPVELAATLEHSDRFLAVSPSVSGDLIDCGVSVEKITVVPNFLTTLPEPPTDEARGAARHELGLPADVRVVIGCGHIDQVKGTDLFVELAAMLAGRGPAPWQFIWLGGETNVRFARRLRQALRRRRIESSVRFAGYVDDPTRWFLAADVVAVTSRAESFSLVALEAAALGRPVVGFAGARGLGWVLGETPALLAPGLDVAALAARVERLLAEPEEAGRLGTALRARVAENFLAPGQVEKILGVTDALRAGGRNRR